MRILFILHPSGPSEGSSIAVLSIIKHLVMAGHEVSAVMPHLGEMVDALKDIGIKIFIVKYRNAVYPKLYTTKSLLSWPIRCFDMIWGNGRAEKKLINIIHIIKPDIIHTNVGVINIGYYVAKRMGIPHVWHIRETEKSLGSHHYPSYKKHCRLLYDNDFNIAITNSVKHYYSLSDNNTIVVYDGVFASSFIPKTPEKKSNYFLFVGRITKSKGVDWAVDAFMMLASQEPTMELWLAGDDSTPYAIELKARLCNYPHKARIKFLGVRNDIYELLSASQAVLVPAKDEGFGFVTVEAMLNRTIVIGRNTSGTKEQFDNGYELCGREVGLRCESVEEMASHMNAVCFHGQSFFSEMIASAEKVVRQLYSVEHNAEQIMKIYQKISSSREENK